jgi:hypothetical protein
VTTAAPLLNTPGDKQSFDIWSFHLSQNIQDCNDAIFAQFGVRLPLFPIYPAPPNAIGEWLLAVSEAIGNITSQLRIQTVDIENVDLDDDRERQAWAFSIFTEMNQARQVLKI